jgi:MFS family permease
MKLKTFCLDKNNRAVASIFFAMSAAFGAWITRLPEIQQSLALNDAQLGTALFFMPLGAVTLLPFYSRIIHSLSERIATLLALFVLLMGLSLPGLSPSYEWLMASLYLIGLSVGLTDVAMNAVAAEIEKQYNRNIMSTCHGFFSIGAMIGAFLSILFIRLEINLTQQMLGIGVSLFAWVLTTAASLVNSDKTVKSSGFSMPPIQIISLATIGVFIMMTEGAITDWSTIYIGRDLLVDPEWAGLGFAGFSMLMAVGRFTGDTLHEKYSGALLIKGGIVVGIIGLVLTQIQIGFLVVIGFSFSGLGLSIVVPLLFSNAAKVKGLSSAEGLAAVASAGYIGWLVGPVTIGYIGEAFGLQNAFLLLIILCTISLVLVVRQRGLS